MQQVVEISFFEVVIWEEILSTLIQSELRLIFHFWNYDLHVFQIGITIHFFFQVGITIQIFFQVGITIQIFFKSELRFTFFFKSNYDSHFFSNRNYD